MSCSFLWGEWGRGTQPNGGKKEGRHPHNVCALDNLTYRIINYRSTDIRHTHLISIVASTMTVGFIFHSLRFAFVDLALLLVCLGDMRFYRGCSVPNLKNSDLLYILVGQCVILCCG